MNFKEHIEQLQQRLQQPLPGIAAQNKMASRVRELPLHVPDDARESAVLALLFPRNGELNLLLIKRIEDGKPHGGQISFPGGRKDPEDESLQITALRETHEEVGIPSTDIEILGQLSSLYIPVSNSNVFPFIGYTPQQPEYILSVNEVQYTLEVPIVKLFQPERKSVKNITPSSFPDIIIKAPVYEWDNNHTIWGATAMMLAELEDIMNA